MTARLGAFDLHRRIGRGGMGAVYRASHHDGTAAAVKVLEPRHAASPLAQQALLNEVRAIAGLDHPGVVALFDAGTVGEAAVEASEGRLSAGAPWVAMELCSAGNLADNGPLDWTELEALLLSLLDALGHIHARGVVHRDLKPENILLSGPTDPRPGWRLADFGIARVVGDHFPEGDSQGTPLYMAPEQVRGERWRIGAPTDLFSLGCLTWERACGRTHRTLTSLSAVLQAQATEPLPPLEPAMAVPDGLEPWIERLTHLDPGLRYASAADAARALVDLGPPTRGPVAPTSSAPRAPARTFALTALLEPIPALPTTDETPSVPAPVGTRVLPDWRLPADGAVGLRMGNAGLGLLPWREVPLVARAAEQQALWDALADVFHDDRPVVRWLRGPEGVGKSRLARWTAERAAELGVANPLVVHLADGEGALGHVLAREHGVHGCPSDEVLRILARRGIDGDQARALASWWTGDGVPVGLRAGLGADRIAALASRRPVVLVLDAPERDPAIPALVQQLVDRGTQALILLCSDDGVLADRPAPALEALVPDADRLAVGPLVGTDAHALVHAALGLEPALGARVATLSEGRPAVALGLVRDLAAADSLEWTEHGFALAPGVPLPTLSADDAWSSRLETALSGLDPAHALAMGCGALVGDRVPPDAWAVACAALDAAPEPAALRPLTRSAQVAMEPDGGWSFTHPALRAAARQRLTEAQRAAVHRALAEAASSPVVQARHWWAAGELEQALVPLVDASEQLVIEGRQKEAKLWMGRWCDAVDRVGLPPSDPRWAKGMARLAAVERQLGQLVEAEAHAREALEHAAPGSAARAYATAELGAIHGIRGDVPTARDMLVQARDRFDEAGLPLLAEGCTLSVATAYVVGGQPDRAWQLVEGMETVDPKGAARLARARAVISMHCGERERARAEFARALEAYRAAGNLHGVANSHNDLGSLALEDGDAEEAMARFMVAASQFAALGAYQAHQAELNIALLQVEDGQFADARARTLPILKRTLRNKSGDVALPRGILLAAAAGLGDWEAFDRELGALSEGVVLAQYLRSLRQSAFLAERAARQAGHAERAVAVRTWFERVEAHTRTAR